MSADFHVQELIPAYALGCLDQDDALLVSQHLVTCPTCQAELQSYEEVVAQLALAVPKAVPSADLPSRLMGRLQDSKAVLASPSWWQRLRTTKPRLGLAWGIASAIIIMILTVSNLLLWQRINQIETGPRSGRMRAIPLTSTNAAPGADGFIIIGADGQNGALVVDKLPLLTPEQQYQLWLIRDGQRTSAAVFSVDEYGYGGTRIKAPGSLFEYSACGVSIEPAGGSPSPTGDRVLAGILD